MITNSIKITSKGQIIILKEVPKMLNSDVMIFEVSGNNAVVEPILDVGESLKVYYKNLGSFDEIREKAWDTALNDKSI